ncbi:MFS transporter [Citrobacter braakii]|jgi:MFS family permease|uniref:MFS transporter n=1 Tax=Citrobacter braakii TaxID=57706 RepID=UPI003D97CE85
MTTSPLSSITNAPHSALLRISAAMFLAYLTIGLPLATLPLYVQQQLQLSDLMIGLAVGSQFISTLFSRGLAGRKADQMGGKRTVVTGQLYCAASGLLMLASAQMVAQPPVAWCLLIVSRVLLGLGESFILTGNLTWGMWLAGAKNAGRVISWNGMATYGALAAGAPLGLAIFAHSGLSELALIALFLPLGGFLLTLGLPGNTPVPRQRGSMIVVLQQVWRPGMGLVLQGIGFASLSAFSVLYFNERGWQYAGYAMTLFGGSFIAVRLFFAYLPDRFGGARVAACSMLVESIGLLILWSAPSPSLALIGAALTGCGCSLMFPSLGVEVVRRVSPEIRGTALGTWSAFQDLAYGLTGPLAGLLTPWMGYQHVFLVAAACALLGAATIRRLLR